MAFISGLYALVTPVCSSGATRIGVQHCVERLLLCSFASYDLRASSLCEKMATNCKLVFNQHHAGMRGGGTNFSYKSY